MTALLKISAATILATFYLWLLVRAGTGDDPGRVTPENYPNALVSGNVARYSESHRFVSGIPLQTLDGVWAEYPIGISQIAQNFYKHFFTTQSGASREAFLTIAYHLLNKCVEFEDLCSVLTEKAHPPYDLPENWPSAMAQGQTISVFSNAYLLSNDEVFRDKAERAIQAFDYPIADSGVRADFDGVVFFEEYGHATKPTHVLNGYIFALSGLYDAYEKLGSEKAREVLLTGLDSLLRVIDLYDLAHSSRYDYSEKNQKTYGIGTGHYHEIHVHQLMMLYSISGIEKFRKMAEHWQSCTYGKKFKSVAVANEKFAGIEASHSTDPEKFGVANLIDGNITWGKYWSTHRRQAKVGLRIGNIFEGFNTLSIAYVGRAEPDGIRVSIDLGNKRYPLTPVARDGYKTGHYETTYITYRAPQTIAVNGFDLVFDNYRVPVLKLRELNVHYVNSDVMLELKQRYGALKRIAGAESVGNLFRNGR